ncbi:MAG: diaminopimelate epimerase [Bacteroidales bacterium]|nr:diaminopimelate epimerase [Bacteroidales bacterium]
MTFEKWHGAGNDFLIADNRDSSIELSPEKIQALCDRHTGFGADGIILLSPSDKAPFFMEFYNPDGSTGMMCGNGGRCIAAFARSLGVECGFFEAADGMHSVSFLSDNADGSCNVSLSMKDVSGVRGLSRHMFFLDTGTRHLVKFVDNLSGVDVFKEGLRLRMDRRFAPVGTNVNFVQEYFGYLQVSTFEKGVENLTLACGTGIVASAIAAYLHGERPIVSDGYRHSYGLNTALATFTVEFCTPSEDLFTDIRLVGPAAFVGTCLAR